MKNKRIKLSTWVTLFTFIVVLLLNFLTSVFGIVLTRAGIIDRIGYRGSFLPVMFMTLISASISIIVACFVNKVVMTPVQDIVDSIDRIAEGDFSVRVKKSDISSFNQLVNSLNRMVEELDKTKMFHNDFINNFSHEFKTPIVSIKGFAEMLKHGDFTVEERNDFTDIIIYESKRLSELSENILMLTKLENQIILSDVSEFNVTEQIRCSIILLSDKWESKNIQMNLELNEIVMLGNEYLMSQVWLNLIDNAIKFSHNSGQINIEIDQEGTYMIFKIQDNGVGIDNESIGKVFDRFYQEDLSHSESGNGLGLAIVSRIVTLHNGHIQCESKVDHGTTFILKFHYD